MPPPLLPLFLAAPVVVFVRTCFCRRSPLPPSTEAAVAAAVIPPEPPSMEVAVAAAVAATLAAAVGVGRSRRITGRCCRCFRRTHSGGGGPLSQGDPWKFSSAPPSRCRSGPSRRRRRRFGKPELPSPPVLHAAASWMLTMVDPGLPRLPRSVAEVLGTGSILSELAAILAEHSWTVHKEGLVRTPEERTGRGLHAFLLYLAFGEVTVSGLEKITLVGVDKDGRVYLMHLLFSVRVNIYLTECRLFACVGELPAEPPPR